MARTGSCLVDVVIPVKDQHAQLRQTLQQLPFRAIRSVVVVDCESTDESAAVARDAGAVVLRSRSGGYGAACIEALRHFQRLPVAPDVVVFQTATASSVRMQALIEVVCGDTAELAVLQSRDRRVGERIGTSLIRAIYGQPVSALQTMRAIRFPALVALGLSDPYLGWNVEMLVKAAKLGLQIVEVPDFAARGPEKQRQAGIGRMLYHIARNATTR